MKYTLISAIKIYINLTLGPYIKAIGNCKNQCKKVRWHVDVAVNSKRLPALQAWRRSPLILCQPPRSPKEAIKPIAGEPIKKSII
jgi:hypothetical protein